MFSFSTHFIVFLASEDGRSEQMMERKGTRNRSGPWNTTQTLQPRLRQGFGLSPQCSQVQETPLFRPCCSHRCVNKVRDRSSAFRAPQSCVLQGLFAGVCDVCFTIKKIEGFWSFVQKQRMKWSDWKTVQLESYVCALRFWTNGTVLVFVFWMWM